MSGISSRVIGLAFLTTAAVFAGCNGSATVSAPPTSGIQTISQGAPLGNQGAAQIPTAIPDDTATPNIAPTAVHKTPTAASTPRPAPTATPVTQATPFVQASATPTLALETPTPSPEPAIAPTPRPTPASGPARNPTPGPGPPSGWRGPSECQGDDVTYTSAPVNLDETRYIEPMGKLHGSHVTPTDHTYIVQSQTTEFDAHRDAVQAGQDPLPWTPPADVRSPAGGWITDIQAFPFGPAPYGFTGVLEDYRVVIWHTCAVSTIFIHMGGLAPEILEVTGEIASGAYWFPDNNSGNSIRVAAGQVIGKTGGQGIDYSVHDNRVMLDGLAVPSHYQGEPWKIHTVDPYAYYDEPLLSEMLAKSPRTAEPRGGQIDYDIEGRIAGNWFLEGTVDYSGGSSATMCGTRPCPYWTGHLSISYDHIDPNQIRISIGADVGIATKSCRVCDGVYGVLGNGPDPADVGPGTGLVKYGLVARQYTGELPVATENVDNEVLGTFLVQMTEPGTIKMEVVAGTHPIQVDGFSPAANLYHR